jgi:hypothetical protein
MSWPDRFDDIQMLRMFVHVCLSGLSYSLQATRVVDVLKDSHKRFGKPERYSSEDYYREANKQAEREEAFGKQQESKGFTYLYALASIKLWSILEATIEDVALECIQTPDRCSDAKLLAGLKGPLFEFLRQSAEERAEFLVGQLKQEVRASMQKGIGRFEAVLMPLGLGGAVPDAVRRAIFELSEVRNVLVHRRGLADKRFVSSCPWFGVKSGDELMLKEQHYDRYELAVRCHLLEIDLRFRRRDDPPDANPETKNNVLRLREEWLKALEDSYAL